MKFSFVMHLLAAVCLVASLLISWEIYPAESELEAINSIRAAVYTSTACLLIGIRSAVEELKRRGK